MSKLWKEFQGNRGQGRRWYDDRNQGSRNQNWDDDNNDRRDRRSYRGRGWFCGSGRENWSEPPPYQLSYAPPWGFPYMPYPGFAPPPGKGSSHCNSSNKKGQNS